MYVLYSSICNSAIASNRARAHTHRRMYRVDLLGQFSDFAWVCVSGSYGLWAGSVYICATRKDFVFQPKSNWFQASPQCLAYYVDNKAINTFLQERAPTCPFPIGRINIYQFPGSALSSDTYIALGLRKTCIYLYIKHNNHPIQIAQIQHNVHDISILHPKGHQKRTNINMALCLAFILTYQIFTLYMHTDTLTIRSTCSPGFRKYAQ